jgi:hypothetical protein
MNVSLIVCFSHYPCAPQYETYTYFPQTLEVGLTSIVHSTLNTNKHAL